MSISILKFPGHSHFGFHDVKLLIAAIARKSMKQKIFCVNGATNLHHRIQNGGNKHLFNDTQFFVHWKDIFTF